MKYSLRAKFQKPTKKRILQHDNSILTSLQERLAEMLRYIPAATTFQQCDRKQEQIKLELSLP